jgi:hypothetical protein
MAHATHTRLTAGPLNGFLVPGGVVALTGIGDSHRFGGCPLLGKRKKVCRILELDQGFLSRIKRVWHPNRYTHLEDRPQERDGMDRTKPMKWSLEAEQALAVTERPKRIEVLNLSQGSQGKEAVRS